MNLKQNFRNLYEATRDEKYLAGLLCAIIPLWIVTNHTIYDPNFDENAITGQDINSSADNSYMYVSIGLAVFWIVTALVINYIGKDSLQRKVGLLFTVNAVLYLPVLLLTQLFNPYDSKFRFRYKTIKVIPEDSNIWKDGCREFKNIDSELKLITEREKNNNSNENTHHVYISYFLNNSYRASILTLLGLAFILLNCLLICPFSDDKRNQRIVINTLLIFFSYTGILVCPDSANSGLQMQIGSGLKSNVMHFTSVIFTVISLLVMFYSLKAKIGISILVCVVFLYLGKNKLPDKIKPFMPWLVEYVLFLLGATIPILLHRRL